MKKIILLGIATALVAVSFVSPLAADSTQSSTEKGALHSDVRGYFSGNDSQAPPADVGQSIAQSRENGGM